ncbi:MAG: hypothetical protein VX252_15080 [Myxococcota bacterium]|nr:hypothetical protein [Myxococcota bacterium]
MRARSTCFVHTDRRGLTGWIVALAALSLGLMGLGTGVAWACDEAPGSPAQKRCQLIEEGVQANLEGHYNRADAIWQTLRGLDPTDPTPDLWEAETAWWRLVLNDGAVEQDERIRAATERALDLADARLAINPDDAAAMRDKGLALMMRTRLDGMRGRYLSAGRSGEKARALLEEAYVLDPNQDRGQFPLAVYYYYAGIAPSFLKWVSWLWFVPKGDREKGLVLMREVRDKPGPHADEARFMLMVVNTYHAPLDLSSALESGRYLHARYPDNVLFHSELVEVMLKKGLYDEAIETALALEAQSPEDEVARTRPLLGRILRAQAVLLSGSPDEAAAILASVDEPDARLPIWGRAWFHLVEGQILDAQGDREAALAQYRQVKDLKGPAYNQRAALIAEVGMETPFSSEVYEERPMVGAGPP